MNTTWHADTTLLARYRDGELDPAAAFSVEAHLTACASCQAAAADVVGTDRLTYVWEEVIAEIDRPRRTAVERLLCAVGVREHVARLLAATPALTLPWIVAIGVVLASAASGAYVRPQTVFWFLVLAPLVPLAGVAMAFGPGIDPTYEVGVAAPVRGLRLLLLRAAAVLVVSLGISLAAALMLPGFGFEVVAWMLPALAVTAAGLAASTIAPPVTAGTVVGVLWVLASVGVERLSAGSFVVFGAAGQGIALIVLVAAALVVLARRDAFDVCRWTIP